MRFGVGLGSVSCRRVRARSPDGASNRDKKRNSCRWFSVKQFPKIDGQIIGAGTVTSNLGSRATEVVSRGDTTFINGGHDDVNPVSIVVTYEPAGGAQLPDTLHAVATASLRDEWASGSNIWDSNGDTGDGSRLTRVDIGYQEISDGFGS